jgi:hypothetical protein
MTSHYDNLARAYNLAMAAYYAARAANKGKPLAWKRVLAARDAIVAYEQEILMR